MGLELALTDRIDRLIERVRSAQGPRAELFSAAGQVAQAEPGARQPVDRLAAAGAFTDAALTLIGRMLPAWRMRSLIWENGEWTCALSRHPILPVALDDTADGHHPSMPLAILIAALEAGRRSAAPKLTTGNPRRRNGSRRQVTSSAATISAERGQRTRVA